MRDIHVFVRHCNYSPSSAHKGRPKWYDKKQIFDNLLQTSDQNVHITVLLDTASITKPEEHFTSLYKKQNSYNKPFTIITKKGGCDPSSLRNLTSYILSSSNTIKDTDIIYILEDDYLHVPNWPTIMREAFNHLKDKFTYLSLYDHPDKYSLTMYKDLTSQLYITPSCHWRTTPSTTSTYALLFSTLKQYNNEHMKFSVVEHRTTYDHQRFVHMFDKYNHVMISSVPAYATHVEDNQLAPIRDWESINQEPSKNKSRIVSHLL